MADVDLELHEAPDDVHDEVWLGMRRERLYQAITGSATTSDEHSSLPSWVASRTSRLRSVRGFLWAPRRRGSAARCRSCGSTRAALGVGGPSVRAPQANQGCCRCTKSTTRWRSSRMPESKPRSVPAEPWRTRLTAQRDRHAGVPRRPACRRRRRPRRLGDRAGARGAAAVGCIRCRPPPRDGACGVPLGLGPVVDLAGGLRVERAEGGLGAPAAGRSGGHAGRTGGRARRSRQGRST